jgi:hypothetical protein
MSVRVKGNLAFGSTDDGDIVFFDMSRYSASSSSGGKSNADISTGTGTPNETKPDETNADGNVVPWGEDNMLPKKMLQDIENCGVLSGGIDGKARFGVGRGPIPFLQTGYKPDMSEILAPLNDPEIDEWLEDNVFFESCFGWFKDMTGIGQQIARIKFSNDGTKIGYCARHDVSEMRYAKKNAKGLIEKVHLSAQWDDGGIPKNKITLDLLPRLGANNHLESLKPEQRANKEFALVTRLPGWGRHYYSMPLWYSARLWVEIAKGVPQMKAAMFENIVKLRYVVIVHDQYWTKSYADWTGFDDVKQQELKEELYDEIEKFLVGAKNAYKSLFTEAHFDEITKQRFPDIEIKRVEDTTISGELLPDSAAANSEILFSLMMNPALMGADTPGGPYSGGAGSGSNIREAAWVQVMIQELERNAITRLLNLVSRINGWKKRHPQLVWRWPGLVLTTLDTGKSSEEVANGGSK